MLEIIKTAFQWLINGAQIKFITGGFLVAIFSIITDQLTSIVTPFINTNALTSAFNAVPPGVWYFIDATNFTAGVTIILGAYIARFLIRRIPFIG